MKHLDRSLFLVMACLASALFAGACRSEGDDDDDSTGDGDADSDGDSDSDGDADSDGDGDADSDGDGDGDENTDELCSDFEDNDANNFTDCADYSCSRNEDVTVCDPEEATAVEDVRQGTIEEGTRVRLENMIVTAIDRETSWYMQSADAGNPDYTGIFVFLPGSTGRTIPAVGDIINLSGEIDDFYGLTEITWVSEPEVVSTGSVEPVAVTPAEVGDEDGTPGDRAEPLESVLVQVMGYVTNLAPTPGEQDDEPTNEFAIGDAAGGDDLLRVDDHTFLLDPMPVMGDHVTIIGNLRFNHGHFALEPRSQDDITIE